MIKKINYIFNRRQKIQLIIMAFMIMLGALLELLGVSSLLPVANVMMDASLLETNEKYHRISELIGVTEVTEFIVMMCAAIIMVYIFKNVYLLFLYYVQIRFAQNNRIRLSSALIDYYLHREYSYHTEHNISEMRRNIISDVESFYTLVEVVIQFFIEIVTCGIILVYIFFTDYRTAFMMLVLIGLPVCSFIIYFRKKLYKQGEKLRSYSVITTKWFLQALGGVKEVKAINKEHFFTEKYTDACWKEISMARRSSLIQKIPRYLVEICCISGMMIIIIARMIHGADLQEFAGTLVVIAVAAARLMPSFNRITEYVGVIMYRKPSLDAIYNDVCMLRKKRLEKDKETGQRLHLINEILVKDLTFKYPNTEKNVFANINLIIKKNTSIALIGPSGAGKTTFADVIMGLHSPDYGQIYVDNIDVFDNIEKWRNSIGYIPQVIYLTDDTIRNNIAFGENEKDIEDEKIWKALKEASLEEFVKGLENGLDTMVGDRGIRLSGGQRQRIGIARALYRDPEILILDEATSALDQDTENAIMESMENLHGNVTMLIIAHRLSTIKNCDVIYEIKDGNLTPKTREQVFDVKRNDLGGTECTNGE